jgi:hypothetical protein
VKVYLLGKHKNRTPFYYTKYKEEFEKNSVKYVHNILDADFVIIGFKVDLYEHASELLIALKKKPALKVIIISEEPLWESIWSEGFENKKYNIEVQGQKIEYFNINHAVSDVFHNNKFPYFITTEDKFFARYAAIFKRNSALSKKQIEKVWQNSNIQYAAIAEKRLELKYHKDNLTSDYYSLSNFRSHIAESLKKNSRVLIEGKGWGSAKPRQKLVDWHLDKLARLDQKCLTISAIENTGAPSYLSEKTYDALACLAIPVIAKEQILNVHNWIDVSSCIILENRDVKTSVNTILNYKYNSSFLNSYYEQQRKLSENFSDVGQLLLCRRLVVQKIISHLKSLGI